ncbi:MAG: CRISPR-associated endonuclease Cas2 [Candidatus Rokubacteria bacterium RBG_16_73_20]|nr:MAG: CRISPR-associated endonuclease Cas2 [Candidatus Rokubacteria bacterium GWA2_73_35]OGK80363.1 MAG: CRISPR-associated endonuclease Cas2 [Candidatus Rokubacteria bacterium GWC2_70_16]OGK94434.1 MAG: CRISPR-associated endonuclease Cas2 [Candidatus Rokubacteria bacterium RBG_16_73_20]HAM57140.1 CRISPR-associated endonuclease Cas2 [Candidatus Rokubacteria bacterium]HBH00612.1 CRISPR-associated endonuclease Cas2 [Candidatus Rokubacteria bacterium]
MRGQQLLTFVVYDIQDDRVRGRVANACKDYGLERIQYSAFCGALDASRRGELTARLADTLGEDVGKILLLPVCEKDVAAKREFVNEPKAEERADG